LRYEQEQFAERDRSIAQRETSVAETQTAVASEKQHWQKVRQDLENEAAGLEQRIESYRRKLLVVKQDAGRLPHDARCGNTVGEVANSPVKPRGEETESSIASDSLNLPFPGALESIEKLADELIDQRLLLTEQCQHLALAENRWRLEQQSIVAGLQAGALRLQAGEQSTQSREQALEIAEQGVRQEADELAQARRYFESGKARWTVEMAAWEGERGRILAGVRAREAALAQQERILTDLRERWDSRRRRQVTWLRGQQTACGELLRRCFAEHSQLLESQSTLQTQQRAVAERALALEQLRQEAVSAASNPAAAEKRLEQLRKHWSSLAQKSKQLLAKERQYLETEADRLEGQAHQLQQQVLELTSHEAALSGKQALREQEHATHEALQAKWRQELQSLRSQQDHYEEQVAKVREEFEHVVHLLLEDSDHQPRTTVQAA
jgi:hypothetical protein